MTLTKYDDNVQISKTLLMGTDHAVAAHFKPLATSGMIASPLPFQNYMGVCITVLLMF